MASHISSLEPRHTTLHTTLGVGLGVSWGAPSRIVVRHFSNFCLCPSMIRFLVLAPILLCSNSACIALLRIALGL